MTKNIKRLHRHRSPHIPVIHGRKNWLLSYNYNKSLLSIFIVVYRNPTKIPVTWLDLSWGDGVELPQRK